MRAVKSRINTAEKKVNFVKKKQIKLFQNPKKKKNKRR